jgi:hypothetical protein
MTKNALAVENAWSFAGLEHIKMKWDVDSRRLQENMADYALSVKKSFPAKICFL